jgi:cell division protein FtsQ
MKSNRLGRKILLFIILILITYWGWLKVSNPTTFPIRSVKILDAVNRIDHQELQNSITPYLTRGMLWLDVQGLENTLAQVPWIDQVTLTRKWPDELLIQITEQIPIARWNNSELLNKTGNIFTPRTASDTLKLPSLYGPPNTQNTVWEGYQEMNTKLMPLGLQISIASMDSRKAWEIYLNNGYHLLLGQEEVMNRLQRFISLYPKIFTHPANELDYVDLRYSNGFAVKWKKNSAAP